MTPEQRLDRVERILGLFIRAGRKTRGDWRERSRAQEEKINILIQAQMKTTDQIRGLAASTAELREAQKRTDQALRTFIKSLHKGGNGNSPH